MTTPTSYIAPDGKLYTYKQYVNWSGYRPVEGCRQVRKGSGNNMRMFSETVEHNSEAGYLKILTDFTIQD